MRRVHACSRFVAAGLLRQLDEHMVEQGQTCVAGVKAKAFRKAYGFTKMFAASTGLCLVLALSGCITGDRLELGVDIPPAYQTAHGTSAAGLPALDFNANATRSRASQAGNAGGGGGSERVSYSMALNASYELDFWGKNRALSRAAQETAIGVRF